MDCMIPYNPDTPIEALNLIINFRLSQFINLYRPMIVNYADSPVPINMYALIFMPSGSGKDRAMGLAGKLFGLYEKKLSEARENYENRRFYEIKQSAQEKYPRSQTEQAKYISDNQPRLIGAEITGDSTLEGLIALRQELEKAGIDSTNIVISEFGDLLERKNGTNEILLSFLQEIYDFGNSRAKQIKGDKRIKGVRGVPANAIFYTSPAQFFRGRGWNYFERFLERGLARRSLVCYPRWNDKRKEIKELSGKKVTELREYAIDAINALHPHMEAVYKYLAKHPHVKLNKKAKNYINDLYVEGIKFEHSIPAIEAEGRNRYWKILKLAGIFALFDFRGTIEIKDIDHSKYQVDFYADQLQDILLEKLHGPEFKLYETLLRKKLSTMELRQLNLVHQNKFNRWFAGPAQDYIDIRGAEENKYLHVETQGRKKIYSIKNMND